MGKSDFIAFDLGASNGRSILGRFESERIELIELNRFSNDYYKSGDGYYWDIHHLFDSIKQGLQAYGEKYSGNLRGVGIDTWGVDFGLIDESGALIGDPNAYRDPRGARGMTAFHAKYGERVAFDITGIANQEYNTIYQLYSMAADNDARLLNADKLLLMPDLLGYMLCGETSCEYTHATTTQMLDSKTSNWSAQIVEMLGIEASLLPSLQRSGEIKGSIKPSILREAGIEYDVPVICVGGHDTASAIASLPVENENYAFISSGTWSLMGILPNHPIINDFVYANGFSNEGTVTGDTRLLQNIMGLWIIQNCKKQWDETQSISWDDVVGAARAAKPFVCVIDVNDKVFFDAGDMIGRIQRYCEETNQYVPQSIGQIARIVFESLAMCYKRAFDVLQTLYGKKIEVLHILGGGSQNELLNQLTANAVRRPVISGPVEATAIGNLMMQLMATGAVKTHEERMQVVKESFDCKTFLPQDSDSWAEQYERFAEITS